MKPAVVLSLAMCLAAIAASPARAQNAPPSSVVLTTSYVAPDGERVLQHQVVVTASLEDAWKAFSTSEGLRSFVAPVASIDFRVGGIWEASYDPKAVAGAPGNIRNEVVAYVPLRMLTIRCVNTPPKFPFPDEMKRLWTVIEFEDLGGTRVRVTASMVGWKPGPSWDGLYQMFEGANRIEFENLSKRFSEGPRKWQ
jgi:uncharacterized protein YndB with AHSA1/START domain